MLGIMGIYIGFCICILCVIVGLINDNFLLSVKDHFILRGMFKNVKFKKMDVTIRINKIEIEKVNGNIDIDLSGSISDCIKRILDISEGIWSLWFQVELSVYCGYTTNTLVFKNVDKSSLFRIINKFNNVNGSESELKLPIVCTGEYGVLDLKNSLYKLHIIQNVFDEGKFNTRLENCLMIFKRNPSSNSLFSGQCDINNWVFTEAKKLTEVNLQPE